MLQFHDEKMFPIKDAPRHLPARSGGKRIHISAVYRWVTRGVRGVVLESVKVGGCIYTSIEALERFVRALTQGGTAPPSDSTLSKRRRRVALATAAVQSELGGIAVRRRVP